MTVRILTGDCRDVLRTLPAESVHCVVTSPPYFGLRDYGTARWDGGDAACAHSVGGQVQDTKAPGAITTGQRPGVDASKCRLCGARRVDSQIGLELTPDAFIAEMVTVFRAVRRVLRKDGTCWLNIGDSYVGPPPGGGPKPGVSGLSGINSAKYQATLAAGHDKHQGTLGARSNGLKAKDLIGIPWRVAFALQADGWWLRQDIIWSKPNPMPESVRDRCTKAHEYLFLLSKSERYYYDAEAVAEVAITNDVRRPYGSPGANALDPRGAQGEGKPRRGKALTSPRNDGNTWNECNGRGFEPKSEFRNRRSVWTVATEPYSEAHFATFPPALIEPCILAGCPEGGTVLDPFGGAGTTGLVADRLQRNAILIELNPAYALMAEQRIRNEAGMWASVEVERPPVPKQEVLL